MVDLPTLDLPAEDERLARLLIGFAEGDLNEAEMAEWDAALSQSEELQELLIATCLQRQLLPQVLADVANETPAVQPTIPPTSPVLGFLGNVTHGAYAYFSEGWPLAYLLGTIIFALGLGIFSLITVNHRTQIAEKCPSPSLKSSEPMPALVGRITGMIDAQWSDINTSTDLGNSVFLGRKYALASGLMEITYDTGAKVILQGPVTYEVDSPVGGYLAVGKLTAKLEKRPSAVSHQRSEKVASGQWPEKVVSGQWPVASETNPKSQISKSQISNPQSLIPNPSSPAPHPQSPAPVFAIRTPSAVVTDLGTEFGVEVDKKGTTISHVFRGSIQVQAVSNEGNAEGKSQVLHENQSARIESRDGSPKVNDRVTLIVVPSKTPNFVREIPKPARKTLDLVDVVAGGDGFSGKRNRGIDPTTGRAFDAHSKEPRLIDDGKYHRVEGMPLIDGVFVPDGRTGNVKVDSAGHTFTGFPANAYETTGFIWAGGIVPLDDPSQPLSHAIPTKMDGIDYSAPDHGLIFLHANKGITFDLEAIRRANPGCKLLRFLATAGNVEACSSREVRADLWVLIDGQSRFQRREVNSSQGAFSVTIPIRDKDRFLTLAASDGGDGVFADWTIFGDPRLELLMKTDSPQSKARP